MNYLSGTTDTTEEYDGQKEKFLLLIDYLANTIGIDAVAFGSDFDGARMPCDLKEVSAFPLLIAALRQSGYREDELEKLACKNWLRVIQTTWDV